MILSPIASGKNQRALEVSSALDVNCAFLMQKRGESDQAEL